MSGLFESGIVFLLEYGSQESLEIFRQNKFFHGLRNVRSEDFSQLRGKAAPGVTKLAPILMSRENLDTADIYGQLMADWWTAE